MIYSASMGDCMTCCISLIIGYGAIVGRASNLRALLFTVVGVFAYQFTHFLLWRNSIRDIGFSLRVFLFGSIYGITYSLFLRNFKNTKHHKYYTSDYIYQVFSFVGIIIAWALLPAFSWISLLHAS